MAKTNQFNKEISKVVITDNDIAEINKEIGEKFNLYFGTSESAILKKIATPNVISILKNINSLRFSKDGTLSVDSLYTIMREVEKNLKNAKIKNPFGLFALIEKLILIYCAKIEETDELDDDEKYDAIKKCLDSAKKFEGLERIKLSDILPQAYYTLTDLMARFDPDKKG